jgi:long-chain acyl-CoA synthetase
MTSLSDHARTILARAASAPAIEFEHRWHSWGELSAVAEAVTQALDASGIGAHAPVAFIPRNHPAAIATLLALIAQGRTIRMIYPFQSAEGIARNIARLEVAAVVIHRQDVAPEVLAGLTQEGLAAVVLDGMTAQALKGFERVGASRDRAGSAAPQIEILTSGTTGPPKQFAVPYAMLEAHFVATHLTRSQGDDPANAPPFLLYFSLGNISGLYSTLPMLVRGQRLVLLERFSVAAWHDYVLRYRPVHSGVPPSCVQQLLDAEIPRADLASIKAMGIGAAPLDPAVQRAFEERYGIPILLSYGATEFAGPVAMMTAELHAEWSARKHGSVGRAMPGAQLRVVDAESGAELTPGEQGLLQVISPRIGPGWIGTADLAVLDADGFLFLHGRADGAIMRGGFKVLPETIESALNAHPAIAESAVVGIAEARLGQVPAAAIRLRLGTVRPEISELEAHLRRSLLATHVPTDWRFVAEIPRNPSLKVDRMALRRLFEID